MQQARGRLRGYLALRMESMSKTEPWELSRGESQAEGTVQTCSLAQEVA